MSMIDINRKEVERYLGLAKAFSQQGENSLGVSGFDKEHLDKIIDECIADMQQQVTPRYTYKRFPIEWKFSFKLVPDDDQNGENKKGGFRKEKKTTCSFAGIEVASGNLLKNLEGCGEIVLMAVTLGPAPDMLVRKAEVRDMMKAYTYQAVGAAMAESWCDEVNDMIIKEAKEEGLFARPRFSPGYGDFPLEVQKDFERILEMPKTVGVTLSDSLLMTPTKSITAVIGLTEIDSNCEKSGCEQCAMAGKCAYSRN